MGGDSEEMKFQEGEINCFDDYALESAIGSTAEAAHGKQGLTEMILQSHLKMLCALQYKRLSSACDESH
ncbi:hypothetical protein ELY33_17135 [Vreelandella andesensis]|uniref:Uncharacterized protein n=1 Tax=Vreelandella andesensis TaxID=447567 RepID=A0A3S0YCG6_9GAMM|nr:hypothetical protein [Halomonas andesensis]RUR26832.1 hypothetical protein ELY33_17135 [Halomonas andesensis]